MAKAENSKQRILALGEILLQETDEEHRLTAAELEEMLRQREIPGERKKYLSGSCHAGGSGHGHHP